MTDQQPEKKGGGLDIIELVVLGLGRYRYWIVVFAILGLLFGVYQSLKIPNTYQSSGKFLIKFGQLEKQTPETVAGINNGRSFAHGVTDEIQILRSTETYERVARELGPSYILTPPPDPTADDGPHTPFLTRKMHNLQKWLWFRGRDPKKPEPGGDGDQNSPKAIEAAVNKLKGSSRFYNGRQSSIMGVEYKDNSPERAQEICRSIMEAAQWRHMTVFSGLLTPNYLDDHLEDALRQEELKNEHFQQHTEECGFFDLPARKEQVLKTIAKLEDSIADDGMRAKEITKELERIEGDIAGIDQKITDLIVPEEKINPQFLEINKRIDEEQKKLELLGLDFASTSEIYLSRKAGIDRVITMLQDKLTETPQFIKPDPYEKSIDNPAYVSLDLERKKLQREYDRRTTGRIARIDRLQSKRDELQDVLECEPIHRAMMSEISQSRGRVGQLTKAKQSNETLRAITKEKEASNLMLVQPASFMPLKVAPKRSKNVMTGLGGGFALGAVFAILRQFLDSRLRFPRTAKRVVGVRVLGVVPEVRGWRKAGRTLRKRENAA